MLDFRVIKSFLLGKKKKIIFQSLHLAGVLSSCKCCSSI